MALRKMPFGALEPLDDGSMGLVKGGLALHRCHILPGGYVLGF
jgi:hypothetical protein